MGTVIVDIDLEHQSQSPVTSDRQQVKLVLDEMGSKGDDTSSISSAGSTCIIQGRHLLSSSNGESPSSVNLDSGDKPHEFDMSWAPTPAPKNMHLGFLNQFLKQGGCSSVSGQLLLPLDDASSSTLRYYKRKAREAVALTLHCIAPGQENDLMSLIQPAVPFPIADELDKVVVKCYNDASSWYTRRQILSILAPHRTKEQLMDMIPGLTKYRVDEARKHAREVGQAQPVEVEGVTRSRLNEVKVDHFLDFISRPDFVQDVAYGTKVVKLSHGEKLEIPKVVRTVITSRIIQLYQAYCEEVAFEPLSRSTLYSIIQVCAASQQKSLSGLDNIAAEGSEAFDSLFTIAESLGDLQYPAASLEDLKKKIRSSKQYLKTDYKLHISEANPCADHCITFALSDGQTKCSHDHDLVCERCEELKEMLDMMEVAFDNPEVVCRYEKQLEELRYDFEASREKVLHLKSHIMRAKNQERCKVQILQELQPHQALVTMDWAMKFLPTKYREAQQDWFGKKGVSWHVSAVITRVEGNEFQIHCYVHVLDQCKQDWFAVFCLVEATLLKMKLETPTVKDVFLRSDNAGCYHNASLLISMKNLQQITGLTIRQYDFSEAQAGKDICDRKIAPMKSHIQRFVCEGHDVTNASEMKDALESYGGVRCCYVSVVTLAAGVPKALTWPGITSFTNFRYEDGGIRVWKAYGIGTGEFFPYTKLESKQAAPLAPTGVTLSVYTRPSVGVGAMKARGEISNVEIPCPENGCDRFFKSQEDLTEHLAYGSHTSVTLKETVMDKVKRKWAGRVGAIAKVGESSASVVVRSKTDADSEQSMLLAGWALRGQKTSRRFSAEVRRYLYEEFMKGVTGFKENPANVAKRLKMMFPKDQWLTPTQVMSYFSRLSAKQKQGQLSEVTGHSEEVEPQEDAQEEVHQETVKRYSLRRKVMTEVGI